MDVQINELQASERSYADKEDLKVQGETRDQVGLLINYNDLIFYPFLFFPDICFYYPKSPNCSSGCLFFCLVDDSLDFEKLYEDHNKT